MKRVAIYVRVSTEDQKNEGLSIDNQIDSLQKYCKENNYYIAGIYNDAGISARKKYKNRPALLQLLEDCKAGKIDLIIFTRLDRWFRSVGDYYQVQSVLDECKIPWRAIWEDYETETSAGIFKVNIMLSIAQAEADRTSEKIKSVMEYKRDKGEWVGGASMYAGYKRANKVVVINEDEKEAVQALFDEYLKSFSIGKARDKAYEYGLDLKKRRVRHMLQSTIYCGYIQNVKTEPYVTQEQHDLIVKSFEERKTRVYSTSRSSHTFSGLCTCSVCGRRLLVKLRTKTCKDGSIKKYVYYTCEITKSHRVAINESDLENHILSTFDNALSDANMSLNNQSNYYAVPVAQIDKLKAKMRRIGDRYEDGEISREEYSKKIADIKISIQELEDSVPKKKNLVQLPDNWKEVYMMLDDDGKRAFWSRSLDKIIVDEDKNINIIF